MIRHLLRWLDWQTADPRRRATHDFLPQPNSDESRNSSLSQPRAAAPIQWSGESFRRVA